MGQPIEGRARLDQPRLRLAKVSFTVGGRPAGLGLLELGLPASAQILRICPGSSSLACGEREVGECARAGWGWSCGSLEASPGTSDAGDPRCLPVLECPLVGDKRWPTLYEGGRRGGTVCRKLQLPGVAVRVGRPVCPPIPHFCFCGPVSRPGKLQSGPLTAAGFSFLLSEKGPVLLLIWEPCCVARWPCWAGSRVPECLWFVTRHW